MPSSKSCLAYITDQLSEVPDVACRPMMGEYVIYFRGKVVGGVYDDRFLVKATGSALRFLEKEGISAERDIPYPGAKEMLVADIDDREMTCCLIRAVESDLPASKPKH